MEFVVVRGRGSEDALPSFSLWALRGASVHRVMPLDLLTIGRLDFQPADRHTFRCLDLAYQVLDAGGTAPTTLNAANEIAVEAFVNNRINFPQISETVRITMDQHKVVPHPTLEQILEADDWARQCAARC